MLSRSSSTLLLSVLFVLVTPLLYSCVNSRNDSHNQCAYKEVYAKCTNIKQGEKY